MRDTPERFAALKRARNDAFEESSLVKPKGLAKAHPDMPRIFRDVFLKELSLTILAWSGKSNEAYREWVDLYMKRYDWWDEHRFDLEIPDDVPGWDAKRSDLQPPTDPQVLSLIPK